MAHAAVRAWGHEPVDAAGAPPRRGLSTRLRLVAAFSLVLAALLAALVVQVLLLKRMEASFAEMAEHDEQMQLALKLEGEIREQYRHGIPLAEGDASRQAAYQEARARASAFSRSLEARLDEPETLAWLEEIRGAAAELDRGLREAVAPEAGAPGHAPATARPRVYQRVSLIEQDVDLIFARLQGLNSRSREALVEQEATALRFLVALLVILPVFVVSAVGYLSRSIARPLASLGRGAAAVAAGDLDTKIDVDTPDEFGALAAEFNTMTASLKRHQERLVEAEKLAAIGRVAAGVAHELNNPLQVMLGYLSLNRDVPDRRLAEQLAATEAEAERCKFIVGNLLELSRPLVTSVTVDLRELCEDVASSLRASLRPAGVALALEGRALALGDPAKVRQVLFNLMKNAAEAAGPAGVVRVHLCATGERVEVAVCDNGPGVAPEVRARLFEPFCSTKPGGTGLGLTVSRALARAHGGDIEVGSSESGGAAFTLLLARAPERRS